MAASDAPEQALEHEIRLQAKRLGFVRCGIASADDLDHQDKLRDWLDAGMHGDMSYMKRTAELRHRPKALLPQARSIIVVIANYYNPEQAPPPPGHGLIARYARGWDYHTVLRERLVALQAWLQTRIGEPFHFRVAVDTAPLLERELAVAAGLGFIGKNTLLITPGVGSYTVIAELLVSVDLRPDKPTRPKCGSCDLCLRACPTQAFKKPRQLDARKCISYLTIEHPGAIAESLRPQINEWVFGCDECQSACPYNTPTSSVASVPSDPDLAPDIGLGSLALTEMLSLRSGAYRRLVRHRALCRTSRPRLVRNAAIAAGNSDGSDELIDEALDQAARRNGDLVSHTVRWARRRRGSS